MKITKKLILGLAIPIILLAATFDAFFIERVSWLGYLFICIVEYTLFYVGFVLGEKSVKNETSQSKPTKENK